MNRTRAMHVERNVHKVLCDGLADDVPLLVRRILEEFLAEVVAERIYEARSVSDPTPLRG